MNDSLFSVEGRIVVVTGGLGQAGRQYCSALLKRKAKVAVVDPNAANNEVPQVFTSYKKGKDFLLLHADVTSKQSLETALEQIQEKWSDSPYGLINNAALDSPPNASSIETESFETFPESSWDRVMGINVKGAFLACQVFGSPMAKAQRGSIVNIGSTYGMVSPDHRIYEYKMNKTGKPFFKPVVYSASKSALVNFTKYMAVYWAKSGVRTNLLVLGGVFNNQDDEFVEGYCQRVPMGRMAQEDEFNGAIIYLMSDASLYMTGASMVMDGGWTSW